MTCGGFLGGPYNQDENIFGVFLGDLYILGNYHVECP